MRQLAVNDELAVQSVLQMDVCDDSSVLDPKTHALVRLGALIALQSSYSSYDWSVAAATAAGAADEEVVAVLVALVPVVGVARVNSAAAHIATAVGIDIDVPGSA